MRYESGCWLANPAAGGRTGTAAAGAPRSRETRGERVFLTRRSMGHTRWSIAMLRTKRRVEITKWERRRNRIAGHRRALMGMFMSHRHQPVPEIALRDIA